MKRPICSSRICLLNLAVFMLVLPSVGCLSLPRFAHHSPSVSVADVGPPVWDELPTADSLKQGQDVVADSVASEASPFVADRSAGDHSAGLNSESRQPTQRQQTRPADRIASIGPAPRLVKPPAKFSWTVPAKSAGDRDIQSVEIGSGGYRTLLIGSLVGNDKLAVELTDRLARHVHENQIVLGGMQLTVIRNLNPDGEATGESETAHGIYLNRQFPKTVNQTIDEVSFPAEIRFLLSEIKQHQPQRVIHVRTIGREQGVVACSLGANDVAADLSNWLGFELTSLPGRSISGTLERYLSESEQCDIVTFAMPKGTEVDEAWDLYSDALMNLLMDDDFATRKLAREQKSSQAADRRNRND